VKVFVQNNWTNTSQNYGTFPALAFYMSGTLPTDKASLLSAVPSVTIPGLLEKCVGLGLLLGTRYADTSLKVRTQYRTFSDKLSMLKLGSCPFTVGGVAYNYHMPTKAYREDGNSGLWWMPPTLFAFPTSAANVYGATVNPVIRTPNVRIKDRETDATTTAAYIVEYTESTTVSRVFMGAVENRGGIVPQKIAVEYWTGTAWASALAASAYSADRTIGFTAVSSTKFRITITTSNSTTSVTTRMGGIALLHTASKTALSLTDTITWVAIVPMPDIDTTLTNQIYLSDRLLPYTEAEVMLNSTLTSAGAMDLLSPMVPMIADSCSASATSSKALITKAASLIATTDRPQITAYDYILGDFA
jgi:hypothetical protein